MAIYYVCKACRGKGRVEKKVMFRMKTVTCEPCEGKGKIRKGREQKKPIASK